jgi:hypothetical protein
MSEDHAEPKRKSLLKRYFFGHRRIAPTWSVPLFALGVYIILFGYYYLYYVPRAQADIINRSFRVLSLMGEQVRSAVENSTSSLRTASLRNLYGVEDPKELDVANPIPSDHLERTTCRSHGRGSEVSLSTEYSRTFLTFRMELREGQPLCRWITLEGLLGQPMRSVPAGVFDDLMVSNMNGNVVYQKTQSEFRLTDICSLLDDADLSLPTVQTPASGIAEAAKSLFRGATKPKATRSGSLRLTVL